MKKIKHLTAEQEQRMLEFRSKWIAIGLSIESSDHMCAERAIYRMYESAGLVRPKKIVWCGSPLSQGLTRSICESEVGDSVRDSVRASVRASVWDSVRDSVGDSVRASVWDSVGDSVRDSVRASVWDSVRASVRDSVRDSVGASVGDSVRASVGDSVRASVWDSVGDSVRDSVGDSVRDSVGASVGASVWDSGYGQHDASWLAFYEYFRKVLGLRVETEKLVGHFEQAKSAGWYLPHQHICWVSERHNILQLDARGRLHSETGPAVGYPDGWSVYAWHGIRVPARVIEERAQITVKEILTEKNTEVRRVMRNLYGDASFMVDAGAKEIDHSKKHKATLLALQLPGDPVEIRMMRLTCPSTGSVYFERVPPDVKSAIEGLSWRFNVSPSEYKPLIET
jgi:hypothetical protein